MLTQLQGRRSPVGVIGTLCRCQPDRLCEAPEGCAKLASTVSLQTCIVVPTLHVAGSAVGVHMHACAAGSYLSALAWSYSPSDHQGMLSGRACQQTWVSMRQEAAAFHVRLAGTCCSFHRVSSCSVCVLMALSRLKAAGSASRPSWAARCRKSRAAVCLQLAAASPADTRQLEQAALTQRSASRANDTRISQRAQRGLRALHLAPGRRDTSPLPALISTPVSSQSSNGWSGLTDCVMGGPQGQRLFQDRTVTCLTR